MKRPVKVTVLVAVVIGIALCCPSLADAQGAAECSETITVVYYNESDQARAIEVLDGLANETMALDLPPMGKVPLTLCARTTAGQLEGQQDWKLVGSEDVLNAITVLKDGDEILIQDLIYSGTRRYIDPSRDRRALEEYIVRILSEAQGRRNNASKLEWTALGQISILEMQALLAAQNQRIIELLEQLTNDDG